MRTVLGGGDTPVWMWAAGVGGRGRLERGLDSGELGPAVSLSDLIMRHFGCCRWESERYLVRLVP